MQASYWQVSLLPASTTRVTILETEELPDEALYIFYSRCGELFAPVPEGFPRLFCGNRAVFHKAFVILISPLMISSG